MRLFKYAAVLAVASAGKKFETNEAERQCMSDCKDEKVCHGQDLTDGPTDCIQECRDRCVAARKEKINDFLRSSDRPNPKKEERKAENVAARTEQRKEAKMANPAPMVKDFHQLYEDGEVPRQFIACLKEQREAINCIGHGEEMWDCKRQMVINCLDQNDDFEGLGSERLSALIAEFRENIENMEMLAKQASMEMDATTKPTPTENPDAILGVRPNSKNKVKVNKLVKHLNKKKHGKTNLFADETFTTEEEEEGEDSRVSEAAPVYEDEEEAEDAPLAPVYDDEEEEEAEEEQEAPAPVYDDEPEEEEEEEEEEVNTSNMEMDIVLMGQHDHRYGELKKEEVENRKQHREHMKKPKALYSYVGNGGSRKVAGGKNSKAHFANKHENPVPHVKRLSKDQFVTEMCKCRTSMEHYRVNNYLVKHGGQHRFPELKEWKHKEETCKWCAFPNSKKCWQCQSHWKKASQAASGDIRVRNEQTEMACFLYVRSVKTGKFNPMNSKKNDPCPMRQMHHGTYNAWHAEGRMDLRYQRYKELHHAAHNKKN